jgi:curved DNA-binding protein CbpA
MNAGEEHIKYFELLEIPPGSTMAEVSRAYNHLKELYSRDSIVTFPLADELSDEQREEILKQVKEAYAILMDVLNGGLSESSRKSPPGLDDDLQSEISDAFFSGDTLKRIREKMGVSLHDIELATKVRSQYLKNIEHERYSVLPEAVFVKGYLQALAKYLSLNPQKVLADYMQGYDSWKKEKEAKARGHSQ